MAHPKMLLMHRTLKVGVNDEEKLPDNNPCINVSDVLLLVLLWSVKVSIKILITNFHMSF